MVALIIIGILLTLGGIIGCIIPGIPGPPLNFLALILLSIAKKGESLGFTFLMVMAAITIVVTVLDYIIPAAGAKKFGASRWGFWGAIFGLLIGLIFFPPWGMIIGAFLGALVGEAAAGKHGNEALKAGWGVLVGVIVGTLLKLLASAIMTFYFVKALL